MFKLILFASLAYLVTLIVVASRLEMSLAIPLVVVGLLLPILIVKFIIKRTISSFGATIADAAGKVWQGAQARVLTVAICERPAQLDEDGIHLPDHESDSDEEPDEREPLGYVAVVVELIPDLDASRAGLANHDLDDDDIEEPRWDPSTLTLGLASEDAPQDQGGFFGLFANRTPCAYYEVLDAAGAVTYDNGKDADEEEAEGQPRYDLATRERYCQGLDGPGRVRLVFPIGPRFNGQATTLYAFQHALAPIQLPRVEITV